MWRGLEEGDQLKEEEFERPGIPGGFQDVRFVSLSFNWMTRSVGNRSHSHGSMVVPRGEGSRKHQ